MNVRVDDFLSGGFRAYGNTGKGIAALNQEYSFSFWPVLSPIQASSSTTCSSSD